MNEFQYNPNKAIHPGKTLEDLIESINMTQIDLASRSDLSPKTINEIIQGKSPITPETAIKLSSVFGMSSSFWNNLQNKYVETLARIEENHILQKELSYLPRFSCYKELVKWGYISKPSNKIEIISNLLNFFGVSSLSLVPKIQAIAFRSSSKDALSKESLAAWLRCGVIDAQKIDTQPFNKTELIKSIDRLRSLTKERPEIFQKKLINICASCGIALVFVPYFKKTGVNGATTWLASDKAIIQLSLRSRFADIFWFTFFHELAHILIHGKKDQFVEFDNDNTNLLSKEKEADEFSCDVLIPKDKYSTFIKNGNYSDVAIKSFANSIGINSSIIAGRICHDKNLWKKLSHLRQRLVFVQNN